MKKSNVKLNLMLVASLLIIAAMSISVFAAASDIRVTLLNQDPDPVEPGNYVDVRFSVENYGDASVDNVLIEVMPQYPFYLEPGVSAQKSLGSLTSRQTGTEKLTQYYKLRVDDKAVEGNNNLEMKFSVDNGQTWNKVDPFTIRVKAADSILSVAEVKTIPEKVAPGETFEVHVKIKNEANTLLKNIRATLSMYSTTGTGATATTTDLPFAPISSGIAKTVASLDAGAETDVVFSLIANADADNKPYKMPLTITYDDQYGQAFTKDNIVGIVVYKKPQYLVNLENSAVYMNRQKGKIIVSVSDIGSSKINYLSMKLLPSPDYSVISTDTIYIGNLNSDDYETAEFEIYSSTNKKTIPLNVELNYKDSYNTDYKDTVELKGIDLYSESDAEKFGLVPAKNIGVSIIGGGILVLFLLFMIMMLIDDAKNPMPKYKKIMWGIAILTGIGAILYFFMARKKKVAEH